VPVDDAEPLADAIARLAGDADLRARYGAAGRRLVEAEFSAARIGGEIVMLYRQMLEQRQRLRGFAPEQREAPSA
jgi:glycosyltransferase involved in cell wall biosynthesis